MPTVRQLPARIDVEFVAGDPFSVVLTATSGVTTFAAPVAFMTTAAGDAYTTDPGIPTASAASAALTCAWSAADTAALNTSTRAKSYKYSVEATADGEGAFQIFGGTVTVHPIGYAGTGTTASVSQALTLGGAAVSATIGLGASGGGSGGASVTISDTAPSSPTAGDLWYDSTSGLLYIRYDSFWVGTGGGGGSGGGGASALDDLSDVTITAGASGDILRHNGTAWVDAAGIVGTDITSGTVATARLGSGSATATSFLRGDQSWAQPSLDNLSDVAITAAATNDVVAYNGSTWADVAISTIAVAYVPAPGGSDDTALFTAAEAALPADGGTIWLSAGAYALPSGYAFTKRVRIQGQGIGNPYGWNISGYPGAYPPPRLLRGLTSIICDSTTATCLSFAETGNTLCDLAIINTSVTNPTAGAGVVFSLASLCRMDRVAVTGFYDNVDINNGGLWAITGSYIADPVRYGVRIRNVNTPDEGDGFIGASSIYAVSRNGSAGIQWESGGGMKVAGCKINGYTGFAAYDAGIRYALANVSTSVGTITGCSIENAVVGIEFNRQGASGAYSRLAVVGNQFGVGTNTDYGVWMRTAGFSDITISDNVFGDIGRPIRIDYGTHIRIGTNQHSNTTLSGPAIAIGSTATDVLVERQQVNPSPNSYSIIVADESVDAARVDYVHERRLGAITSSNSNMYSLTVRADRAGTFDFRVAGIADGVGAFSLNGTRSYIRTGSGNVTLATVGVDLEVGAASTDVEVTFDTTTTAGVIEVLLKLRAGATATDLDGTFGIDVKGHLSQFRVWA